MAVALKWKGDYLHCDGVVRAEVTRGAVDRLFYFLIDNEWGHRDGFKSKTDAIASAENALRLKVAKEAE